MKFINLNFFKLLSISVLTYFLSVTISKGQDLHYSQYYNAPLSLNPSLSGKMVGDFRVGVNYRRQWKQIQSGFITTSLWGDINFPTRLIKNATIGVGVIFTNDVFGDAGSNNFLGEGILKSQSISPSISIHKTLDRLKRHKVSFGIQPGFVSKKLDNTGLYYKDQISGDNGTVNGAPVPISVGNGINYPNINLGAFYTYVLSSRSDVYIGASLFNITNPKEQILIDQIGKRALGHRTAINGGFNYKVSDRISLMPTVLVMLQNSAMDLHPGTAIGYKLGQSTNATAPILTAGVFYRVTDAAVFMTGLKWNNFQLGLSYDATTSSIRDVKKGSSIPNNAKVGAFEVSLIYTGFLKRALPHDVSIPCKFF